MNVKEGGVLFILSLLVSFLVYLNGETKDIKKEMDEKYNILYEKVITHQVIIISIEDDVSKIALKLDKSEYENDQVYENKLRELELEKLEEQIRQLKVVNKKEK